MPRGKKKAANGNGHKNVTFKIGKREGGSITFQGVPDPEAIPAKAAKTLEKFGLGHDEGLKWRDETLPNGDDVYLELENLARYVEVTVQAKPTKRGGVVYVATVGHGNSPAQGKTLTDALVKAHREWNREGRVVGGKDVSAAIFEAIS